MPVIGVLSSQTRQKDASRLRAWERGLQESGFVEGRDFVVEYRSTGGAYDALPRLAKELVGQRISVLYTVAGTATALAAKRATSTIPIVFVTGGDPIKAGLVKSLSAPGGNVTGVNLLASALNPKRLQVIRQLVPRAQTIGFLYNPQNPNASRILGEIATAAHEARVELIPLRASNDSELNTVFASFAKRPDSLIVATDSFLNESVGRIVAVVTREGIPAIYGYREFVSAGGLAAYGTNEVVAQTLAGGYVGRILKGDKPSELPVQQTSNVELVLNRKTAAKLRLVIPNELLLRADEVIE